MTDLEEGAKDAALWQRWRQHAPVMAPEWSEADPLALAAYAEGRLDEARAELVEGWLAAHLEALADVVAGRAAATAPLPPAPEALVARAAALVAPAGAKIVPFRASAGGRRPPWRLAMAWGAIAASLLVTSMGGFALGNNAYLNLAGQPAAAESMIHELLDPPGTLFADEEETAS